MCERMEGVRLWCHQIRCKNFCRQVCNTNNNENRPSNRERTRASNAHALMSCDIEYSEKYEDSQYEYR